MSSPSAGAWLTGARATARFAATAGPGATGRGLGDGDGAGPPHPAA
jgi:hypothetical protein